MVAEKKDRNSAYHKHAQVFTPAGVVFFMIMADGIRELVQFVDKTMLDPAVGEGQFPCAELVMKMFYNIEQLDEDVALRALKSLYGIDIQSTSVDKAREHLILTLCAAYKKFTGKDFTRIEEAKKIVSENMIVGDSLKLMAKMVEENSERQMTLFKDFV